MVHTAYTPPDIKLTKTGQPRLNSTFTGPAGVRWKVVGKMFASGNRLIGLILEDEKGSRKRVAWPLKHGPMDNESESF